MKKNSFLGITFLSLLTLSGCSNLFENVFNFDGTQKTGDDSLIEQDSTNTDITSGLVVIKNTDKTHNQITYDASQTEYFVGTLPVEFSDFEADYTNGTRQNLLGKDDPVEFRCFKHDQNATITWKATQTWVYVPQLTTVITQDADGNEVVYRRVVSQHAEKFAGGKNVPLAPVKANDFSAVQTDLPYGVTIVTCTVTADDDTFKTEYTIVLTKKYVTNVADSSNGNNVTDHGLVVIKQTAPDRNAIEYSSTTYEYEIGDSTGKDTTLDLTGRDDPVIFKCYLLDENAELKWSAKQTKKYEPVWNNVTSGGIVSQNLVSLDNYIEFDFIENEQTYEGTNPYMRFTDETKKILSSNLPYGVTEVTAKITAYNKDVNGDLIPFVNEYKITLTKRYIITTATTDSKETNTTSGLVVLANGKEGNLISYNPKTFSYEVNGLTGANTPEKIIFYPEEPDFTEISWTAVQTETYIADTKEYTTDSGVTYVYQTGGKFVTLSESAKSDLLQTQTLSVSDETTSDKTNFSLCTGNLPYGKTVVTITSTSLADIDNSSTYTITFTKKQVATNINITESSGDISTVIDRGLVALSADDDYSLNHIIYDSNTNEYPLIVSAKDNGSDGMKFRCYLADTDAKLEWSVIQTKEFTLTTEEKEITDSLTGEVYTVTTPNGQIENDCLIPIDYIDTSDDENNEITAIIPYGVTEITAKITSDNEISSEYKIILTRDKFQPGSTSGNYSLLKTLDVSVISDSGSDQTEETCTLNPEFKPEITTYTLEVPEEADEISIAAIAEALDAKISSINAITKYGTVPNVEYTKAPLIGGTSRISFTVTDETNVSRTYSIYVEKPEDGDTTLSSLVHTPENGFENGVKSFTFDKNFKGATGDAEAAKYKVILSADSRKNIEEVTFTAIPSKKRTKARYGISDSETTKPSEWSEQFTKADNLTKKVELIADENVNTSKTLWIETVSDAYYHYDKTTGEYASIKTADTTYHKVKLTKAGRKNTNLGELVIVATYETTDENGNNVTKEILRQTSTKDIEFTASNKSINVTTFADKLDFYFRPLNKDSEITYTAKNTVFNNGEENTSFTGYKATSSKLSQETGECELLTAGTTSYYHLEIGEVEQGTASTKDLPNGTTVVTIGNVSYTIVKPDLSTVSYSVQASAIGEGNVYKPWEYYIYLDNTVTSLKMDLTTTQQNEIITLKDCKQTSGANGSSEFEEQNAGVTLHHYSVTEGENIVKWQLLVGNASDSVHDYTKTSELNTLSTVIPVGTTTLKFTVTNNGTSSTSEDYIYYIIRASDSESRLSTLKLGKNSPAQFITDWNTNGLSNSTYYYAIKDSAYEIDGEAITLTAQAVSSGSIIKIEKAHTNEVSVSPNENMLTDCEWKYEEDPLISSSTYNATYDYTFTTEDAGTVLFKITVTSQDKTSTRTYYLLAYVEADKTCILNHLNIIQKGKSDSALNDENNRDILNNSSFESETYEYKNLWASLNCTGDIVITPEVYEKAKIIEGSISIIGQDYLDFDDADIDSNYVITIPYEKYIEHMGKTYTVTYKVQAQDESVDPAIYSAEITIPTYTEITETSKTQITTEYQYEIPLHQNIGLGYRFGSLIVDESSPLLGKFGGLDIIASCNITSENPVWYESSFGGSGLQFYIQADDITYGVKLDENGNSQKFYTFNLDSRTVTECKDTEIPNLTLKIIPTFVYEETTPYLSLSIELENPDGLNVNLGASIDTLVGTIDQSTLSTNDSVTVEETNNGFTMLGDEYTFAVVLKNAYGVTNVDHIWYGKYESEMFIDNIFNSSAVSGLNDGEDSSATFSWTLGNETSYTKSIRFSMTEKTE